MSRQMTLVENKRWKESREKGYYFDINRFDPRNTINDISSVNFISRCGNGRYKLWVFWGNSLGCGRCNIMIYNARQGTLSFEHGGIINVNNKDIILGSLRKFIQEVMEHELGVHGQVYAMNVDIKDQCRHLTGIPYGVGFKSRAGPFFRTLQTGLTKHCQKCRRRKCTFSQK